jgi:hypothetical protein
LILPLWAACKKKLGVAAAVLEGAIDLCHATAAPGGVSSGGGGAHEVQQLAMVCAEGAKIKNCVPPCTAALNGDELLLNIFGEDTRMTCELHLTLYSAQPAALPCRSCFRRPKDY